MVAPTSHDSAIRDFGIVTPEAVLLEFSEAGLGSRSLAFIVDLGVRLGIFWAIMVALGFIAPLAGDTVTVIVMIVSIFSILLVYPVVCEVLWNGKTVGKMLVGLRAITVEGAPVRFRHAAIRASLGLVDFFASAGTIAILSCLGTRQSQRLGDLAAGTIVIRERQAVAHAQPIIFQAPWGWEPYVAGLDTSALDDEGYVMVRSFLLRVREMRSVARQERAQELATWVAGRLGVDLPEQHPPETFLIAVASAYQARHAVSPSGPSTSPPPGFVPPGTVPPPVWRDEQPAPTWGSAPTSS